jgi:hypothetical protein
MVIHMNFRRIAICDRLKKIHILKPRIQENYSIWGRGKIFVDIITLGILK